MSSFYKGEKFVSKSEYAGGTRMIKIIGVDGPYVTFDEYRGGVCVGRFTLPDNDLAQIIIAMWPEKYLPEFSSGQRRMFIDDTQHPDKLKEV